MSKLDDNIKDIYEGQNKDLPQGFWEDLQPHIPVYEDKERKLFGFPFFGCLLGSLALVLLIGGGSLYYFTSLNNTPDNLVSIGDITPEMTSKTIEASIVESKVSSIDSASIANAAGNNIEISTKSYTEISKLELSRDEQKNNNASVLKNSKGDQISNSNSGHTYLSDTANNSNSTNQNNRLDDLTTGIVNQVLKKEISVFDKETEVNSVVDSKEVLSEIAYVDRLEGLLISNPVKYTIGIIPVNNKIIPVQSKGKKFVTFGYNTVFAKRSITPSTRASWRSNKLKFERDFISHELKLDFGYFFSNIVYAKGGARFTRIQELFDYQIELVNQETFEYQEGLRTIKHTNDLNLIDLTLGLGVEKQLGKFSIGAEVTPGYNILFSQKGIGLNEADQLSEIESTVFEEINMYKDLVGFSLQGDLLFGLKIRNNINVHLNFGGKHYFNEFTENKFPLSFNYKSIHTGLSIRYSF